jgi:hypothetical protein
MIGASELTTTSSVMITCLLPFIEGISNITSVINFSTMARSPRAPVFCFIAVSAMASMAPSVN